MSESEFQEADYLAANPDVADAVERGQFRSGREHYELFGRVEGRMLGWFTRMSREQKALYGLDRSGLGLEIGPSHNPIAPKRKGYRVHILDVADALELRRKYTGHGVNLDNIEDVDFVWKGEPLYELIGNTECYDWIIASHVIEHVPDLISFLQQCERLLKPEGVLSLVIPDKRYCFDYFSPVTSTGELLDAWWSRRTRPSPGKVFDHFANAVKRDGNGAWGADTARGEFALIHTLNDAKSLWERALSTEDYMDVHCWRFTPASFRLLLSDLRDLGLTEFGVKVEFDTVGCEFFVSLGKGYEVRCTDRLSMLKQIVDASQDH